MSVDATGQHRRSQVIHVARTLWPAPVVVSIRRRRGRHAREWLIVPSLRHPSWLLPARLPGASQALLRHDLGQRKRWLSPLLATLYRHAPLARLPLARVRVDVPESVTTIEDELYRILGVPVEVCVRLGRTRVNRALVLQPIDDTGQTVGFVKMAMSDEGERALRAESVNLELVRSLSIHPVIAPEVISLQTWNNHLTLLMTPLLPVAADEQTHMPEREMLNFAMSSGRTTLPLGRSPAVARLRRDIESLPTGNAQEQLGAAISRLLERYGDRLLPFGCWHGDWVPWNMAWAGARVQLWDWEHFEEGVPVGWDILHYQAQHLRNSQGTQERDEQQWLEASRALLRRTLELDADDSEAVILSYLLQINVRYLEDRGEVNSALNPRPGWGLPMLTRLTREVCA